MLLHPLDFTRERSTPLAYEEAICAKLFWQVFARSIRREMPQSIFVSR